MFDFSEKLSSVIQNPLSLFNNPPPLPDAFGIGPNFDWSVARSPVAPPGTTSTPNPAAGRRLDRQPLPYLNTRPGHLDFRIQLRRARIHIGGPIQALGIVLRLHNLDFTKKNSYRQPPRTVLDPFYDWSRYGAPPSTPSSDPRAATPNVPGSAPASQYQTPQTTFATPSRPTRTIFAPSPSADFGDLSTSRATSVYATPSPQRRPALPPSFGIYHHLPSANTTNRAPTQPSPHPGSGSSDDYEILDAPTNRLLSTPDMSTIDEQLWVSSPQHPPVVSLPRTTPGHGPITTVAAQRDSQRPLFLPESPPSIDPNNVPGPSTFIAPIALASPIATHAVSAAPAAPIARTTSVAPIVPAAPAAPVAPVAPVAPIARTVPIAPAAHVTLIDLVAPNAPSESLVLSYQGPVATGNPGPNNADLDDELAEAWGMDLRDTGFQSSDSSMDELDELDELADEVGSSSNVQVQEMRDGRLKAKIIKSPRTRRRQQKKPMTAGTKWLGGPGGGFKFNAKPAGVPESTLRRARWSYSEDGLVLQNPNERLEGDVHFSPSAEGDKEQFICWVCALSNVGLLQWVRFTAGQPHPQYVGSVFKPPQLPQMPPRWIKESTYKSTQL
ncbi:hypothetical protein FRC12_002851 [Ceratobasidium sp. 428]|nr:hypothetical protein FRC12_002851 [Ceratobasidium sp. 428]